MGLFCPLEHPVYLTKMVEAPGYFSMTNDNIIVTDQGRFSIKTAVYWFDFEELNAKNCICSPLTAKTAYKNFKTELNQI
jgi:hypothetical protein